MNDDVERRGREWDRVPPQKQIRLGPSMRPQRRRIVEIGLPRDNAAA
jgi:hypothetical protein